MNIKIQQTAKYMHRCPKKVVLSNPTYCCLVQKWPSEAALKRCNISEVMPVLLPCKMVTPSYITRNTASSKCREY